MLEISAVLPSLTDISQSIAACMRMMMMLPVPHSGSYKISMGTMMCNMDGTGITPVVDHHGTMGVSSPMQKKLSYSRISTSVTSRLLSRVSKEDRRNQPSLMV